MKQPRKNREFWVGVLFGSLRGSVRVLAHFFYFLVWFLFGSWQNLGSGSVHVVIKRR